MRLNSSTYPLLHALETGSYNPETNFSSDLANALDTLRKNDDRVFLMSVSFGTTRQLFREGRAKYIAKTFDQSIRSAGQKIIDAGDEYLECALPRSIYLNQNGGTTIFTSDQVDGLKALFIGFDRNKVVAFASVNSGDYGISGWGDMNWLKQFVSDVNLTVRESDFTEKPDANMTVINNEGKRIASKEMHLLLSHWVNYHLITNYFVQFCDVETKEVAPRQKIKLNGEKHLNETKRNFSVLDCTWFTTLIHTHGHRVDGFFRWQRYGKNRSQRKFIWIDGFERKAYTRKAKVLTQNTNGDS